jgi:hypothetical protein
VVVEQTLEASVEDEQLRHGVEQVDQASVP